MKSIDINNQEYNELRDDALKRIELNQERPSNLELNFLGLTTYMNKDEGNSLLDKIIKIKESLRRIEHIKDRELFFMPLQNQALSYLFETNRALIMAPTSFGKTLIVKEFIYKAQPKSVVYIVPTNALSFELETSFKSNKSFSNYEIFNKSIKTNLAETGKNLFFIGTQEKFSEVRGQFGQIDLFIIDEAYKLGDSVSNQRGYILSKTFLDSIKDKSKRIVLLFPNAKLSGFNEYGFVNPFVTTFNAVAKDFIRCYSSEELYERLQNVSKNSKTILYCDTPGSISDVYDSVPIIENNLPHTRLYNDIVEDFHKEWSVAKYLKKGVLVHHGQMPKYIQNKMIDLFNRDSTAKLLVGTNSISEGINTPTKNLFIDSSVKVSSKLMLIKNTIGRAGRLGEMPVGYIYSTEDFEKIYKEDPSVSLSVADDESLEIVEDSMNEAKLSIISKEFSLEEEFLKEILKERQISVLVLQKILKELVQNKKYKDFTNIVYMAIHCFSSGGNPNDDKIFLKGLFQPFYYNQGEQVFLNNYRDRVLFFKNKKDEKSAIKTDSDIIDGYMKFMYATLDYNLLPIALIAKRIREKYPSWMFGENIYESIADFLKRYYSFIYNVSDFESLSDNVKSIMASLREYGVNLKDSFINIGLFNEIEKQLSNRFSMYDIVNAIVRISNDSKSQYDSACKYLITKYLPL